MTASTRSAEPKAMLIIDIRRLTAGYDGRAVLHDVSLGIERGAFVGIGGPNGGGKTTLVKSLLGLIPPMAGDIRFYDAQGDATPRLAVGYLPQLSALDPLFPISVGEVILSGLMTRMGPLHRPSAAQRRRVAEVTEAVGLTGLEREALGALSGGQRQRALLGRAIVARPELLVLDEPDSYLDAAFEVQLYDLLQTLHRDGGVTILVVTHTPGTLAHLATEVLEVEGNVRVRYHKNDQNGMRMC